MPVTKTKPRNPKRSKRATADNGNVAGCVLTLAEAAAYLRVSESAVLNMVREQGLPARQIGTEWRILQSALEDWLRTPAWKSSKEALMGMAGAWKDDPYLDEMLQEIYKQRGRPMTEEGE